MTKCTACRVRHLTCDQNSVCSECAKGGRECIRGYNLRFRHLACPSETPSRADYSKYEFFFDGGQTWVDTNAKVEFVPEEDELSISSPTEGLTRDNGADSIVGFEHQSSLPTTYQTPGEHPSTPIGDPPDYLDDGDTSGQAPLSKLDILANQSLVEASLSGETLHDESRMSYPQTPATAVDSVWPLRNLQEGRLLQHFITHLAPWVCTLHLL